MKIKFITLNIWDGGRLFDSAVSFIKKEDPDIIVMQEVYDGKDPKFEKRFRTMNIFKKELKYPYSVFSEALLDTRSIGNIDHGNAIFSKFPIINHQSFFFGVPYGKFDMEGSKDWQFEPTNMLHTIIDTDNSRLNVFNVHGIWGFDGKDNERRLKMSEIIADQIKDKENVILAGDFNVQPNTRTIQNIEQYLKNVFKDELKTTFNMKHKNNGGYATSVVDMVFVSKTLKIVDHYCPKVDISDHLPLVCVLE